MDSLIPSFKESIYDSSLKDVAVDVAEIGIDGILNLDILQQIPIVRLIIGTAKTAQNIRDRNALKQTVAFLKALRKKDISQEKLNKHKEKLDVDATFAEEELGRVLTILDSTLDVEKSKLLAGIYRAYIEGLLDWGQFCELSDVTNRLFISDIQLLREINLKHVGDTTQCDTYRADRLAALGLVSLSMKSMYAVSGSTRTDSFLKTTPLGALFCQVTE